VIRESKYPIGIEDTIETGGDIYKIGINLQGKISLKKQESQSKESLFKVVGKYKESGNKIMLRLHDGRIIQATEAIEVNDSILIKDGKISKRLKLEKGAACAIIDGVHVGTNGKIVSITGGTMHKQKSLVIEGNSGRIETLVGNIMVTG
jgi:ribosomal protein S4E